MNPERRVSSHHGSADLHTEQPLFVDPGSEDPAVFIEFRRESAAAVDGNERGAATIEALQLNRPALRERRRERRELLFTCVTLLAKAIQVELSTTDRDDATRILNTIISAASDHGEYSSMTRSFVRLAAPWRQHWEPPADSLLDELRSDAASGLVFQLPRWRTAAAE